MPDVVSCILQRGNKILILQRSQNVGTYRGLWGGVTGFIEADETALQTAYKEIFEETGINENDVSLKERFEPILFTDVYQKKRYDWIIHPFLFLLETKCKIQLDWEHIGYAWIDPIDIIRYDTVPKLREIVEKIFL